MNLGHAYNVFHNTMYRNNLVPFTVTKATSAKLIWMNQNYLVERDIECITKRNFLDKFSYVVAGNEHFDEIELELDNKFVAEGEVYASGINGGGARVGNINGFQVKGVGKNPLAGTNADTWHSYGGNALSDGVLEVTYSTILQKIMPLGVVQSIGLIYTGEKTALTNVSGLSESKGCLLVREACIRPAHFLPVKHFTSALDKDLKITEPTHSRKLTEHLILGFGEVEHYSDYLVCFLRACAQQFGYAKLNRIFHGAMTDSNISIDGKWLDLTCVTFGGAGRNLDYGNADAILPFDKEHAGPLNFVWQLVCTFNETSNTKLDIKYFANKYSDALEYYCKLYSAQLIGAYSDDSAVGLTSLNLESATEIQSLFWDNILSKNGCDSDGNIESSLKSDDPLIAVFEKGFSFDIDYEKDAFFRVLKSAFETNNIDIPFNNFLKSRCISSLKKAYFSQVFFRPRVLSFFEKDIDENYIIEKKLNSYETLVTWIYDENIYSQVIFKAGNTELSYDARLNTFKIRVSDSENLFSSIGKLLDYSGRLNFEMFIENDFNFFPYIEKMLRIVDRIDRDL